MSESIYVCAECSAQFKNIRAFTPHLKTHGLTSNQYYDKYLRKEHEGCCEEHGKETSFRGLVKGYDKFCGTNCGASSRGKKGWSKERKETHRKTFDPNIGGGRPKGSKNKNPYPKSAAVISRYKENPPPSWKGKRHKKETILKMEISAQERIRKYGMTGPYKGKYKTKNPHKYKGNIHNITYRSSWELQVMVYLDTQPNVEWWASEEFSIPYYDPISGKKRRYFPDFIVKTKHGIVVYEVKPAAQSRPPKKKSRATKQYIKEVTTWGVNQAKWEAAILYCEDRDWKFQVLTEDNLFGKRLNSR